ncbi:MAG: chalcone isomerase family protein [Burkholderiales bacterium]|nr:chalcone isomerase family protein [Burkholderiales bacterium]
MHPIRRARRRPLVLGAGAFLAVAVAVTTATLTAPAARAQGQGTLGTIDAGGVKLPTTANVGGTALALNGAGVRYRFVLRVYSAGLYLSAKAGTPEAVLAASGPKRMHVVMLRDIDAEQLGRLFTRGMQDNAPKDTFSRSVPGTLRLAEIFSSRKKLAAGENFSIDWLPGTGTVILVNGQPQGAPIKEPEFFQALMLIWLGGQPVDASLKEALLGREVRPVTSPGQQ